MTVDRWQLVMTTPDPARAARFWCLALNYTPQPPPDRYADWDHYAAANGMDLRHGSDIDSAVDPTRRSPRVLFDRDDPGTRGAISIEIVTGTSTRPATVDTIAGRVAELASAGAIRPTTTADRDDPWAQLHDPDGHPFRII